MKWKRLMIILIIACFSILLIYKVSYSDNYQDRMNRIKNKAIICLDKNCLEEKYTGENDIMMNDCSEYLVDYNNKKQTIIYLNNEGKIVERNIHTGSSEEIIITDIERIKMQSNEEETDTGGDEKTLHNLCYGPTEDEISFTFEDSLYTYNFKKNKISRITECLSSTWCNTYEWKNENEVYVTPDSERLKCELYLQQRDGVESQFINYSIRSFVLNDDGTKIYCIRTFYKYNGISMESKDKLMEINLEDGAIRELQTIDTDKNYLLKIVDDKYLIYVEQKSERKKSNRVYCMNLETGQKKCIYKADKRIIGIIVE